MLLRCTFLIAVCLVSFPLWAEDAPQFRGAGAAGLSSETGLPTEWSDDKNIAWKTALPGYGASSPIVWGDRVYLTGYSGYGTKDADAAGPDALQRRIVCLNLADGAIVWDQEIKAGHKTKNYQGFVALHGYASHTPVTDGESIYAYFGTAGAVAVDIKTGEPHWQTDCGNGTHGFGTGASPVLYKDLLIVNACVESGCLIGLDKKTGKEVWRSDKVKAAWNTPLLVEVDGGHELVVSMKGEIVGYDPATGETLWTCQGIPDYVCPSAVAADGVVYAVGGRPHVGLAVKAGGRGDVTDTHRLYELERGSNVSSPVLVGDRLYWAHEGSGIVYAADAKTGEILYEERLQPRPGRIYASPLAADGKLYYVSRDKGTFVLKQGDDFELLAHNVIESDDSISNASPVAADGKLLLRSDKFLYCLQAK